MPPDPRTGAVSIEVTRLQRIDQDIAQLPILHLDATLRPGLAGTVLPGLDVTEITASMPQMRLTAVQGSFGKSSLVEDAKAAPDEIRRRRNRLRMRRSCPLGSDPRGAGQDTGGHLQADRTGLHRIPGVETGHFKAIAGLDAYKNVALLIVIWPAAARNRGSWAPHQRAYLGHVPTGGYHRVRRGLLMRDGSRRPIVVIEHEDAAGRAHAGSHLRRRGDPGHRPRPRGEPDGGDPLEVQVLAEVALPLVHDRVLAWEAVMPDIVQRMLPGRPGGGQPR
jgi:hypothetical protein